MVATAREQPSVQRYYPAGSSIMNADLFRSAGWYGPGDDIPGAAFATTQPPQQPPQRQQKRLTHATTRRASRIQKETSVGAELQALRRVEDMLLATTSAALRHNQHSTQASPLPGSPRLPPSRTARHEGVVLRAAADTANPKLQRWAAWHGQGALSPSAESRAFASAAVASFLPASSSGVPSLAHTQSDTSWWQGYVSGLPAPGKLPGPTVADEEADVERQVRDTVVAQQQRRVDDDKKAAAAAAAAAAEEKAAAARTLAQLSSLTPQRPPRRGYVRRKRRMLGRSSSRRSSGGFGASKEQDIAEKTSPPPPPPPSAADIPVPFEAIVMRSFQPGDNQESQLPMDMAERPRLHLRLSQRVQVTEAPTRGKESWWCGRLVGNAARDQQFHRPLVEVESGTEEAWFPSACVMVLPVDGGTSSSSSSSSSSPSSPSSPSPSQSEKLMDDDLYQLLSTQSLECCLGALRRQIGIETIADLKQFGPELTLEELRKAGLRPIECNKFVRLVKVVTQSAGDPSAAAPHYGIAPGPRRGKGHTLGLDWWSSDPSRTQTEVEARARASAEAESRTAAPAPAVVGQPVCGNEGGRTGSSDGSSSENVRLYGAPPGDLGSPPTEPRHALTGPPPQQSLSPAAAAPAGATATSAGGNGASSSLSWETPTINGSNLGHGVGVAMSMGLSPHARPRPLVPSALSSSRAAASVAGGAAAAVGDALQVPPVGSFVLWRNPRWIVRRASAELEVPDRLNPRYKLGCVMAHGRQQVIIPGTGPQSTDVCRIIWYVETSPGSSEYVKTATEVVCRVAALLPVRTISSTMSVHDRLSQASSFQVTTMAGATSKVHPRAHAGPSVKYDTKARAWRVEQPLLFPGDEPLHASSAMCALLHEAETGWEMTGTISLEAGGTWLEKGAADLAVVLPDVILRTLGPVRPAELATAPASAALAPAGLGMGVAECVSVIVEHVESSVFFPGGGSVKFRLRHRPQAVKKFEPAPLPTWRRGKKNADPAGTQSVPVEQGSNTAPANDSMGKQSGQAGERRSLDQVCIAIRGRLCSSWATAVFGSQGFMLSLPSERVLQCAVLHVHIARGSAAEGRVRQAILRRSHVRRLALEEKIEKAAAARKAEELEAERRDVEKMQAQVAATLDVVVALVEATAGSFKEEAGEIVHGDASNVETGKLTSVSANKSIDEGFAQTQVLDIKETESLPAKGSEQSANDETTAEDIASKMEEASKTLPTKDSDTANVATLNKQQILEAQEAAARAYIRSKKKNSRQAKVKPQTRKSQATKLIPQPRKGEMKASRVEKPGSSATKGTAAKEKSKPLAKESKSTHTVETAAAGKVAEAEAPPSKKSNLTVAKDTVVGGEALGTETAESSCGKEIKKGAMTDGSALEKNPKLEAHESLPSRKKKESARKGTSAEGKALKAELETPGMNARTQRSKSKHRRAAPPPRAAAPPPPRKKSKRRIAAAPPPPRKIKIAEPEQTPAHERQTTGQRRRRGMRKSRTGNRVHGTPTQQAALVSHDLDFDSKHKDTVPEIVPDEKERAEDEKDGRLSPMGMPTAPPSSHLLSRNTDPPSQSMLTSRSRGNYTGMPTATPEASQNDAMVTMMIKQHETKHVVKGTESEEKGGPFWTHHYAKVKEEETPSQSNRPAEDRKIQRQLVPSRADRHVTASKTKHVEDEEKDGKRSTVSSLGMPTAPPTAPFPSRSLLPPRGRPVQPPLRGKPPMPLLEVEKSSGLPTAPPTAPFPSRSLLPPRGRPVQPPLRGKPPMPLLEVEKSSGNPTTPPTATIRSRTIQPPVGRPSLPPLRGSPPVPRRKKIPQIPIKSTRSGTCTRGTSKLMMKAHNKDAPKSEIPGGMAVLKVKLVENAAAPEPERKKGAETETKEASNNNDTSLWIRSSDDDDDW